MKLVPLTQARLDETAQMWRDGWRAGHLQIVPEGLIRHRTLESFRARLVRHRAHVTLALEAGAVRGMFLLHGDELDQFYVHVDARGTGLAMPLMRAAEDALRAKGHARVWLACTVGNDRAARFYEKAGWARMGTKSFPAETLEGTFPLDVWRFEKTL